MLGEILGGFIVILIGTTILPTIANSVVGVQMMNSTTANPNLTGGSYTLVGLVTLFFAIGIMTSGIALAVGGLKKAGLM